MSGAEAGALSPSEPADSDVDLAVPAQRTELRRAPGSVLALISLGGALGAVARYGIGVAFPVTSPGFPWPTLLINVLGCLLIGILMVLVTEVWTDRPLVRPFLGVGVLGGFTTFSTYVVDIQRLAQAGAIGTALAYLGATLILALAATGLGLAMTRRLVQGRARP